MVCTYENTEFVRFISNNTGITEFYSLISNRFDYSEGSEETKRGLIIQYFKESLWGGEMLIVGSRIYARYGDKYFEGKIGNDEGSYIESDSRFLTMLKGLYGTDTHSMKRVSVSEGKRIGNRFRLIPKFWAESDMEAFIFQDRDNASYLVNAIMNNTFGLTYNVTGTSIFGMLG